MSLEQLKRLRPDGLLSHLRRLFTGVLQHENKPCDYRLEDVYRQPSVVVALKQIKAFQPDEVCFSTEYDTARGCFWGWVHFGNFVYRLVISHMQGAWSVTNCNADDFEAILAYLQQVKAGGNWHWPLPRNSQKPLTQTSTPDDTPTTYLRDVPSCPWDYETLRNMQSE